MSRPATTVPLRVGAHRIELPADALAGAVIRRRLPNAAIRDAATGVVVGQSGTEWEEVVVRPAGSCTPDEVLERDLWESAGTEPDGSTSPHGVTVCTECLDSWACDWQIELVLPVEGSGGS